MPLPSPLPSGKTVSTNAAAPSHGTGPLRRTGPNHHFIQRPGSRRLVIFFSGTGKDQGKFDFWNVGRKITENLLFVSDGGNHWYQSGIVGLGPTVDRAARRIRKWGQTSGIEEYITVGASMGGFGAMLYACKLGGRALVFGSDTILKLPLSRSAKQMPPHAPEPFADVAPLIEATSTRVQLYVGEMDVMDVVAARRVAHLPTVSIQTLSGCAHRLARHIHAEAGLIDTMNAFVHQKPLPRLRDAGAIMDQPEVIRLYHEASLAEGDGNWPEVGALCGQALAVAPSNLALRFLLGKFHLKARNDAEALKCFEIVARSAPRFEEGLICLGIALQRLGEVAKAVEVLRQAAILSPRSPEVHYHLALVCRKAGDWDLALSSIRSAARLRPGNSLYGDRLRDMEEERDRKGPAKALQWYFKRAIRLIRPRKTG